MTINADLLVALAALLSSLASLIWSIRRSTKS